MGGLSIDHGGVIAVDTEELRAVAARIAAAAGACGRAATAVEQARVAVSSDPEAFEGVPLPALRAAAQALHDVAAELAHAADGARRTADVFEIVELRAKVEALAHTDAGAATAAQARLDRLLAADPALGLVATALVLQWTTRPLFGPGLLLGGLGPSVAPAAGVTQLLGSTTGFAKVQPGERLRGHADPVRVTAVARSAPRAPSDLTAALRRLPESGGAQVAVERYTMKDGATRYVAYLSGTRSVSLAPTGTEPWDMRSNVQLYAGTRSASYQATLDALAASGAQPGDRVDVVAYSQSGMIAAHVAMESDFDVELQITAGSPSEPTLDDDQTLVQLRHADDVVSRLATGGSAEGTGSADSFTASRLVEPLPGPDDLGLGSHGIEEYEETARLVDASSDPRAEALGRYWIELGEATEVERTEYRAERVG
ncbi:hypothetical protein [Microbacterium sufflavum]